MTRVAIYAAPGALAADETCADPGRALLERAESWLGRSTSGRPVEQTAPAGWSREQVDAITVDARRYGFHATLKAPFHLAEGRTLDELDAAVARFAAERPVVSVPSLSLSRIGRFFALTPGDRADALYSLAEEIVRRFDEYRAQPSEAELARRNPDGMTPRQRELFERWGYPYVLDEYRFHLTLTDRIPPERQADVEAVLEQWFHDSIGATLPVNVLALFTEAEPGAPFELFSVHPLTFTKETR